MEEYPIPATLRYAYGSGYKQVNPTFPPWYEEDLKETAANWGYNRQVPVYGQNSLVAFLNSLGVKGITDASSGQQSLAALLLQRQFANDNGHEFAMAADKNATDLYRGLTISGLLRHIDDNHVLTTEALAGVIKNGEWVTAQEVNITATKAVDSTTVGKIADLAQKALDTAYGGVIGLGRLEVPQPLNVKMV